MLGHGSGNCEHELGLERDRQHEVAESIPTLKRVGSLPNFREEEGHCKYFDENCKKTESLQLLEWVSKLV